VSEREVERKGGKSRRPSMETVEHVNKRTGKRSRVPIGVDPAFNHNPGKVKRPVSG
jgi:hypothetical protein